MDFVDYYAALNLKRDADAKQIRKAFLDKLDKRPDPNNFSIAVEAYGVLRNRYKRARYDRALGHLLVIQTVKENYYSGITYKLSTSKLSYGYKKLIQYFKDWVTERFNLTWEEAQAANYNYQFKSDVANPYVLFRFPQESALQEFAKHLLELKVIRRFDD